jgi:hypothetical protein
MTDYPRQVVIESPLWDFMEHCEVYCSASCCGMDAFEVHHALILRKVIDENLGGKDGQKIFKVRRFKSEKQQGGAWGSSPSLGVPPERAMKNG